MARSERSTSHGINENLSGAWLASLPTFLFIALPFIGLVLAVHPKEWLNGIRSDTAQQALWLTLRTTSISTALCFCFGMPAAYLLARTRFWGKEILDTLTDLPSTIPPVVAGVALLFAFGRYGLIGKYLTVAGITIGFTTTAVVMAQTFIALPYFLKSARSGFESVDIKLEHTARLLGISRIKTFFSITLPLVRPAIVAGLVLAWARALSEFGATMMFAGSFPGRTQTLSLAVVSAMDSDTQTAVAISTLSVIFGVSALIAAKLILRAGGESRA